MLRRVCLAALVTAAAVAVIAAAPAHAAPRMGSTSLPPKHPSKLSAQTVAEAPFPYANTFKLHSLPGAQRVVYLDFDGDTISNTAWNTEFNNGASFAAPAYDVDGNTGAFSNGELDLIQAAWQRVAEDYAPFNIDVTTEDPGAAAIDRSGAGDLVFGTRALITNTTTIYSDCGCAGVGYIGVYSLTSQHQQYQPALIFGKAIGAYDKDLGDAISHEVGHNLGLDHDGKGTDDYYLGQGAWAPLMGAGYYRPITQWSKGEYAGATNTQDDFAVMQQNGAPLRVDDVGNTIATATPFSPTGTSTGVITTDADVDVFSFVGTGATPTFSASPAAKGPNLDVKLELLDSGGAVLASADPASGYTDYDTPTGLSATVSAATTLGQTYYVRVQGVGAGDPVTTGYSGYGSVGQYTLTGPGSAPVSVPSVSVNDPVVFEGNSGVTDATFTLSLSGPALVPITTWVATSGNTAEAGIDFNTLGSTPVLIPAGQTTGTVTVQVLGDTVPEPHEKFALWLSGSDVATVLDNTGFATIVNDDGIGMSINDVAVGEGGALTNRQVTFTITLSTAPKTTLGVTVATANNTALAGSDYYAKTQILSFPAGIKQKQFTVTLKGDNVKEPTETFFVNLTNPTGTGARITDSQGVGYIRNDDV